MFVTKCKNALLVVLMLALVGVGAGIIGLDWISGKTGSAQALAQQNKNGNEKNTDKPNPATNAKPVDAIKRMQLCLLSQKNLKVIGVALHNFNDTYRLLPAPAIYSKDGKPLLSWRVTLLPFIEQDQLYKQFKLDEPWDSRHNKKLLARMPRMYAPVGGLANKPGVTYYQALVGKGAAFEPRQQLKFPAHFADGTSNTIMVVEAGSPVPWTKPQDLPYVEDQALPKFGGLFSGDFNALFADGAVHFLSKNADPDNLRAAITRAGGDLIDLDKMKAKGLGFADGQQLDGKTLPGVNARLKKVIEATLAEVEKTRKEVELLKLKARGIKNADAQTLKLLQENAKLQEMLERALSELEKLRQQKEQLGKVK